jgi:hypothetical protein
VNLLLTRACDQGCAFCYARDWRGAGDEHAPLELLVPALEHYAELVRAAGPPPPWRDDAGERALLAYSAGTVNLLGGEPTRHPDFAALVRRLDELGLGVHLFTSGSRPEVVRSVADRLGFVTVNGRFVGRATELGIRPERLCAHLPLRPGDPVEALLEAVAEAGMRSAVLAFAAPAGGARGPLFTMAEREAMAALHARAVGAADRLGLTLGWDCAPPRCVVPEASGRCLPVPVLDADARVGVCGGDYLRAEPRRPLVGFASLVELHSWTVALYDELRRRPSPFEACRGCVELNHGCHGLCLGYREALG